MSLRKELSQTKKETKNLKSELSSTLKSKRNRKLKFQPKRLNQKIKRLTAQNVMLRANNPNTGPVSPEVQPLADQVNALRSELRLLGKQKREIQRYHKKLKSSSISVQLENSKAESKSLKEKIAELENKVLELEDKLDYGTPIPTMDGNQYDVKTRKTINYCLQNNVSHEAASGVVEYVVKEMTGKTLQSLPNATTCANIAREFGELSNIQCGERATRPHNNNATFAFDGTTKAGKKIQECHLITAEGSLTLDIAQMPSGTAIDSARQLREALSDVTNSYALAANEDVENTSKKIHDG